MKAKRIIYFPLVAAQLVPLLHEPIPPTIDDHDSDDGDSL